MLLEAILISVTWSSSGVGTAGFIGGKASGCTVILFLDGDGLESVTLTAHELFSFLHESALKNETC
jgi:hypothetical protein